VQGIGSFTIPIGNFVVNGIDLAGTYATSAALAAYINSGVIPFVQATLTLNNPANLILTNLSGGNVSLATSGQQPVGTYITFSNFSLVNGSQGQNFFAMALDQFYINYLQYRLADRLCTAYNFIMPLGAKQQLAMYQNIIAKRSNIIDMTSKKISTLATTQFQNWAQVNIGHGWTTF
jgi:hypothetical protein